MDDLLGLVFYLFVSVSILVVGVFTAPDYSTEAQAGKGVR